MIQLTLPHRAPADSALYPHTAAACHLAPAAWLRGRPTRL